MEKWMYSSEERTSPINFFGAVCYRGSGFVPWRMQIENTCQSIWCSYNDRDNLVCTSPWESFASMYERAQTELFSSSFYSFSILFSLLRKFYGMYEPDIMLSFSITLYILHRGSILAQERHSSKNCRLKISRLLDAAARAQTSALWLPYCTVS
jgi:hypothetical protein